MGFKKDFIFGAASAAYQIEGGWNEDGKGASIWDVLSKAPDICKHNENGDTACDSYHRYKEDVAILKELGIKNYRFSIAWTRVLPEGTGRVNEAGLKYYSDLVDELLARGITPYVTLYHWDLPYELYKRGGWLNPDSTQWFLEYIKTVVDALSDRVQNWFTINEPQCFIGLGHQIGKHAPFLRQSNRDLIEMARNVMLSHGRAAKYIREKAKTAPKIGFAPIGPVIPPKDESPEAIEAAYAASFDDLCYDIKGRNIINMMSLSLWSDPIVLGRLPEAKGVFSEADLAEIAQPLDFYGANIYYDQMGFDREFSYENGAYVGSPRTATDWPVTPEALYWGPKFLYRRYGLPVIISEDGMAGYDWVHLDGKVHDPARIDFLQRYLGELERAAEEVPVLGYFYWSLLDNLEWDSGYDKRFGLVHVDFRTFERTIKDSGYWYADYIKSKTE